ncbi:DNA polymerase IV [Salinirubellus salinus]|uniref:DNA polymerase IV n=1 Tax=Salinirubellus salinus TaxID=1364945 RepID=A0A9E7R534_9EURY|nr:DNA polymerase IV [Salinirubellus salinus]UWM55732.1 DNA polymerase IV [Salinirubellus salinus]
MNRGPRLPGVEDEGEPRVVVHVDMDCFYAACERLKDPDLVGEPLVVGMGYDHGETHGAVATASYEAREYGVESAMPISQALEALPRRAELDEGDPPEGTGHYRPVDMDYYQEVGAQVKAILHESAETVREVSIDEAYLDVSDVGWRAGTAEAFGEELKARIREEVGVTASVGIAPNMSAAKVASDFDKPDGLVVVRPGEVAAFFAPLDVEELHGVGPVTARELREAGIETAGDVADADPRALADRFGERGRALHRRANGRDDRAVEPQGDPKSVSSESAFVEATADPATKREKVRDLAAEVAERAAAKGALYRTIGIKVVEPPFATNTRAKSLPGPVDDPALVEEVALDLLTEFETTTARKLGVRVSNLEFGENEQSRLGSYADAGDESAVDTEGTDGERTDRRRRRSDRPSRGQTTFGDFDE